jgi:hypothetical protein
VLTKRILRQFALPPARRWELKKPNNKYKNPTLITRITAKTKQRAYERLHYMACAEETKAGEPHLHILLRAPFIPQQWISEQMEDLIQSPIVWIERIKSTKSAIAYVSKYVAKAPAQFGKSKRYWMSRHWEINKGDREPSPLYDRGRLSVVHKRYEEWRDEILYHQKIPVPLTDGWFRVYSMKQAIAVWGTSSQWIGNPDLFRAHVFLGELRRGRTAGASGAGPLR